MAKTTSSTVFLCSECGFETGKWLGCCPSCGTWNSISAYTPPKEISSGVTLSPTDGDTAIKLCDVKTGATARMSTGISELDMVLGGGIVNSMAVLIGGDPGIGKSTLLMRAASELTDHYTVLYVTGEESASQLKLRAERLGANQSLLILAETSLERVIQESSRINPQVLIIDSIQTMLSENCTGASGSISQIRECTSVLLKYTKSSGIALFIVGHVTKDGQVAGPRTLEHMVDTVLYFEGDRYDSYRLLRAVKNRFGSTNEVGVFEMTDGGIEAVDDVSSVFLSDGNASGCAVTAALEGTRPIPVEVQALLSNSPFGNPRRMATGFDTQRLHLLLAVLEQKAGLRMYDKDVYINAVGGIRMDDRSNDLAICLAIASAYFDKALDKRTAVIGEVGLTGELRAVSKADIRIKECIRLGFNKIIMPSVNSKRLGASSSGAKIIYANSVKDAFLQGELT